MNLPPNSWLALVLLAMTVVTAIPMSRICQRVGLSRFWGLLCGIPLLNIPFIWAIAYRRWPFLSRNIVRE